MTKIQLAAKAVWNGLIVIMAGQFLSHFFRIKPKFMSIGWTDISIFIVLCVLLGVCLGMLKNFRIPLYLTHGASIHIEPDSLVFFASVQRLVFIFAGLCLAGGILESFRMMAILAVQLMPSARGWISQWVAGQTGEAWETTFGALQFVFYPAGYLLFCIYLLLGADWLVRRQITLLKQYTNREHAHE